MEELHFEIGHFCTFETSMTLTLTLDWLTRHTNVYHSSTSVYLPNFVETRKTFCRQTDRWMDITGGEILTHSDAEVST